MYAHVFTAVPTNHHTKVVAILLTKNIIFILDRDDSDAEDPDAPPMPDVTEIPDRKIRF